MAYIPPKYPAAIPGLTEIMEENYRSKILWQDYWVPYLA